MWLYEYLRRYDRQYANVMPLKIETVGWSIKQNDFISITDLCDPEIHIW